MKLVLAAAQALRAELDRLEVQVLQDQRVEPDQQGALEPQAELDPLDQPELPVRLVALGPVDQPAPQAQ